jgi:HAD superfamily hydrolase (TIGR01490 family)
VEAAFFDLDKTVITKASMVAFGGPFYRGGLVNRRTILRALWGHLIYLHLGASEERLSRVRESLLALTKGWSRSRVMEIVSEALEETVEPIIFSEALELISAHRESGRRVFIVSASPEEIVLPLGRYLGADGVIASRPSVDARGRYTGEMEFYAYGEYKAEAMRQLAAEAGIDLEGSFAYTDSYTDAPMLEAVGNPVVVNPDRVLLRLAHEREWEVKSFVRPVRLRPRVGAPLGRGAAAAYATAATVGAAVVVWKMSDGRAAEAVQSARSLLAATTPRATSTARSRSFFMDHKATLRRALPARALPAGLTAARRRLPLPLSPAASAARSRTGSRRPARSRPRPTAAPSRARSRSARRGS